MDYPRGSSKIFDFSTLDKVQLSDLVRVIYAVICCLLLYSGPFSIRLWYIFHRSGERVYIPLTALKLGLHN